MVSIKLSDATPLPPLIVFFNGDIAEYVIDREITKKDGTYKRIYMILDEKTIEKYNLEDEVESNEAKGMELNSIIRDYKSDYYIELPSDQLSKVILMLCNFNGINSAVGTLQKMAERNSVLERDLQNERNHNSSLLVRVKRMTEQLRELGVGE